LQECAVRQVFVRSGLVAIIATAAVSQAQAHAFLTTATPAVGSTISASPAELDCNFTEALEPAFSTLTIQNAAGAQLGAGKMHLAPGDAKRMVLDLPHLPPGVYHVTWHATSVDTHRTEGHFSFTIAP
jgi:methionine-rich copper-binding protein CopC